MFELYDTQTEEVRGEQQMTYPEAENLNQLLRESGETCRWVPVQVFND